MEPQKNQLPIKDTILQILYLQKFIKRQELRQQLTYSGHYISDRNMRLEIESMIVDDGFCISSGNHGYSLIRDKEELSRTLTYLEKKEDGLKERRIALVKNFDYQKEKLLNLKAGDQIDITFV